MINTERALRNKVLKHLKSKHIFVMSLSEKYFSGYPDLLCIDDGKIFFIELKKKGGITSKIQLYMFDEIQKNGGTVFIVDNFDLIPQIILQERMLRTNQHLRTLLAQII